MPRSTSGAQGKKPTAGNHEIGQLFQHNPLPMWVYDQETLAFLAVNDAAIENYGFSEKEFLKMTIKDIRPASEIPVLLADIKNARPDLEHSGEWQHRTKDGRILIVEITSHLIEYEKRKAALVVAKNITDQKIAELALRESESRLRYQAELVENITDAIISCDLEFHILTWNRAAESIYGWKAAETIRQDWDKLCQTKYPGITREKLTQELLTTGKWSGEVEQKRKDGERIYIQSHISIVRNEKGLAERIVTVNRDISQRRVTEAALRESEERFRAVFEQAAVGVAEVTPEGAYVNVNQKYCEIVGYSEDELIGHTFHEITHPADVEITTEKNTALMRGEITAYSLEKRFVRKDGFIVWVNLSVGVIPDENGKPKYLIGVSEDITERKTRERELEALYQGGTSLQQVSDPKVVARKVIELLEQHMEWHHAAVWIRQGHTEIIEQLAYSQTGPDSEEMQHEQSKSQAMVRTIHTGLSGWVIGHGEAVRNGDVANDPRYAKVTESVRSGLYVPLKVGKETIGCISAESTLPEAFSAYDERLLTTVAAQAAVALDNARLYEEIRQNSEQLSKLNALSRELGTTLSLPSIYHTAHAYVCQFLDCPDFGISLLDPLQQTIRSVFLIVNEREVDVSGLQPLPHDSSQAEAGRAKAITTAFPVTINDLPQRIGVADEKQEPHSAIYTPMVVDGLVIGILEIHSYQKDAYTDVDAELLSTIANQIGLSIQNAGLFTQIEHQLRQLSALRTIDNAISSNTDLNTTLSIILDHVKSELGVDAADILLFRPETMTLEHAANRGFHSDAIQRISLRLGEGIAGKTAVERKPVFIENLADTAGQFHYAGLLSAEQFVTYANAALVSKGQLKGVLEVFQRSLLRTDREWLTFLEMMGNEAAIAIDNADLFNELQRSNLDLTIAYDATIEGWAQALELRDSETEGHSRRVTEMTLHLARLLNIQGQELVYIRRGSLLHDIGKMGVPDYILRKPGPLIEAEWVIMRQHPVLAYSLLSRIPYLRPALDIPYSHHEHWDGNGYPRKLRGEQIPLSARIFAVVDVYDALISDRPYRRALDQKDAFNYIREQSGKHFDPRVAQTFLEMMNAG